MPDTGWIPAGNAIDDSSVGNRSWIIPNSVGVNDGDWTVGTGIAFTRAHATTNPTHYLRARMEKIAEIPVLSTIVGIEIRVERAQLDASYNVFDDSVRLHTNSTGYIGDDQSDSNEWAVSTGGTADQEFYIYGGPTNLWGLASISTEEVDDDLGVGISIRAAADAGEPIICGIDTVEFKIYYESGFKWSIEHLEASTTHGFPTVYVDLDVETMPSGSFPPSGIYDRRLLEIPRLQEIELDDGSGLAGFQRVSLNIDNTDGQFNGFDFQDSFVRIFFVDADGVAYKEFKGQVVDWTHSHTITFNVEDLDALTFTEQLPKRTLNDVIEAERAALVGSALTDFNNSVVADDLGKPIPIIFGRAVKVPLLYVKADETNREYDYIIGEGVGLNSNNFEEVFTVYRDERTLGDINGLVNFGASDLNTVALEAADNNPNNFYQHWWLELYDDIGLTDLVDIKYVTSSTEDSTTPTVELDSNVTLVGSSTPYYYRLREYRFYNGSQAGPYAGYAFIRSKKRFGTSSSTDKLYADVNGLQDEVNRARAIQSILSNSTWGLGLSVDTNSGTDDFDTAATAMTAISAFTCEGIIDQKRDAQEWITDLLEFRDMLLYKDDSIRITVDAAKISVFTFGLGDLTGFNNILNPSPAITYKHPDQKTKDLKVRYRKNNRENDTYLHEFTRPANSNGVDDELTLPFVYDHTTADKALDFRRRRLANANSSLSLDVGDDGKSAKRGDAATVIIPSLGISSVWEIRSTNVTMAGSNNLKLVPYSATPYSYLPFTSLGGTLPVDEIFDIAPDYTNSAPFPVTNTSVSMLQDVVAISIFPYAKITWTPPEDNYGGAIVSVKLHSEGNSEWRDVGTFDTSARVESLIPGQLYNFRITSLNVTGEHKGLAVIEDNTSGYLAGGDSSAPTTPTGLTGSSKFGDLLFTWTNSVSSDVKYHEIEVYTASSGGTLLDRKKYYEDDIPQHVYKRQTSDLTSSLSGWAQVRAVDYSGNEGSFTSRVQATTDDILQDDITENEITETADGSAAGPVSAFNNNMVSASIFVRGYAVKVSAQGMITNNNGTPSSPPQNYSIKRGTTTLETITGVHRSLNDTIFTPISFSYIDENPGSGNVTYHLAAGLGDTQEGYELYIRLTDLRR